MAVDLTNLKFIKDKSEQNYRSAEILSNKNFASSVHCSYYSSLQLIIYILSNEKVNNNLYELFQDECNKLETNNEGGFHNWLYNQFLKLNGLKNFAEFKDIKSSFITLKRLRVNSDYKCIDISKPNASDALKYSKEINDYISLNNIRDGIN